MATKTWSPSALLSNAISELEGQMPGNALQVYGTDEHLAVVRYLIEGVGRPQEVEVEVTDPKDKTKKVKVKQSWVLVDPVALKVAFDRESDFLAYASNAKKKLQGAKLLPETPVTKASGYK